MNKVINGKRYNTETATCYGSAKVKINKILCTLSLFRKSGGGYFISSADGDPEYFKIVSPRQAKVWAFKHLPIDEYEAHFGLGVLMDDSKTSQLLSLKKCTIEKLRIMAAQTNTTMSDVVDKVVESVDNMGGDKDGAE